MSRNRIAQTALHWRTPTLIGMDPRGLQIRAVRYHRELPEEHPEVRVTRTVFDAASHATEACDARLGTANVSTIHGLGGAVLAAERVDAGWTAALHDAAGLRVIDWQQRGMEARTLYDARLRPTAAYERIDGGVERCLERWYYGGPTSAAVNGCAQVLRHDDTAGSRSWPGFALTGGPQREKRRFLRGLGVPDWPEDPSGSDALLEDEVYPTDRFHDATGAVLIQVDAEGHTQSVRYTVDGMMMECHLRMAGSPVTPLAQDLDYDAQGRVIRQATGKASGIAEYDLASGRLRRLQTGSAIGRLVQDLAYTYDPVGNVVAIDDATITETHWSNRRTDGASTFRYDTLSQLVEATGRENADADLGPELPAYQPVGGNTSTPYTQRYTYDVGGNLIQMRHLGERSYSRAFAVSGRSNRSLPAREDGSLPDETAIAAGFDACGNLRELNSGGAALQWNPRNQLVRVVQVARAGGTDDDETYVYGGVARLRKVSSRQVAGATKTTEVRYLPGLELHTDSVAGQAWSVVVAPTGNAPARVLHWREGMPDGLPQDQVRYALGDHLGSVALEIDKDGEIIGAEGYYPYGGTAWRLARNAIEADYRTVRYSGKERDATGLYGYGFRYYAPWLGRWISADPGGEVDGLNLYAFVRGNPIRYADTDGRAPTDRTDGSAERDAAMRAYDTMFSTGMVWEGLAKAGESALDTISNLSKRNLESLQNQVDTHRQRRLIERFAELSPSDYWITHFTRNDFKDDDGVQFKSLLNLQQERNDFTFSGSSEADIPDYGNHDFVFFALDAGGTEPTKKSSRFGRVRYHATMEQLQDKAPYTHMSVADLLDPGSRQVDVGRADGIGWLRDEFRREDVEGILCFKERAGLPEDEHADILFFHQDMLPGLATKIAVDMDTLLESTQDAVIEWTSRDRPTENIGEVINVFFRPQVAVPGGLRIKHGNFVVSNYS